MNIFMSFDLERGLKCAFLVNDHIQGVPHHFGSFMSHILWFLELIRKLKKNESFKKIV